jgi:hypothetical protein
MNKNSSENSFCHPNLAKAEETLRQVAKLPPPDGLTERVHHRLRAEAAKPHRTGFWAAWQISPRLQFAGAAVVMVALASGGWAIYQSNHASSLVPGIHNAPAGSFGGNGAVRVPPTVAPLHVPTPPRKKPSAAGAHDASKAPHKDAETAQP